VSRIISKHAISSTVPKNHGQGTQSVHDQLQCFLMLRAKASLGSNIMQPQQSTLKEHSSAASYVPGARQTMRSSLRLRLKGVRLGAANKHTKGPCRHFQRQRSRSLVLHIKLPSRSTTYHQTGCILHCDTSHSCH
jgi:hypothetical protein